MKITCPYCQESRLQKRGLNRGLQQYWCCSCRRTHNEKTRHRIEKQIKINGGKLIPYCVLEEKPSNCPNCNSPFLWLKRRYTPKKGGKERTQMTCGTCRHLFTAITG